MKITTLKLMKEILWSANFDSIKQIDEIRKVSTWQDDYTTGCLLDFTYFEKNYRLIAADWSKQKVLDSDSRAIQQIIFTGKIKYTLSKYKNNNLLHYPIIKRNNFTVL